MERGQSSPGGPVCVKVPVEPGTVATLGSDGDMRVGAGEAGSNRSWELQAGGRDRNRPGGRDRKSQ